MAITHDQVIVTEKPSDKLTLLPLTALVEAAREMRGEAVAA